MVFKYVSTAVIKSEAWLAVDTDKAVAFARALPRVTLRVVATPGHASLLEWHDEAANWLLHTMKEKT